MRTESLQTERRHGLVAVVLMAIGLIAGSGTAGASPPPQPVARDGGCPTGYSSSGQYCVPGSNARYALPRTGSCPSGYFSSGNYCVASSNDSNLAIPRLGSCPSGYFSSGDYCVASR